MKSLFKGYYQLTPEQFKELWEEGTFVFDTNVLLNLYRYKVESRDEVLNVIRQIKDRIWIPYQVGLEFHRNRLTVLGEQNSSLSTIKNSIRDSISSIEKKCKDLDLDKRHSEIETSSFIERFRELSESVINELDEIKAKKLTNDVDEDVILTELTKLFSTSKGSLGASPKNQKVLEEIYKDGEFRAKNKIPPSFEDIIEAQKSKSAEDYYAFEGLNYKYGYGDLIVWKQIIEFAKENQKKSIIFITNDQKEDWMRIITSHGKKTISARPELVSEIFKEAGVESFYIYNTNNFLNYSKKYLKTDIQDQTIEDIKDIHSRSKLDLIEHRVDIDIHYEEFADLISEKKDSRFISTDINIVEEWLEAHYYDITKSDTAKYDFYGSGNKVYITPIIVKFWSYDGFINLPIVLEKIVSLYQKGEVFQRYHVIIVAADPTNDVFDELSIHSMVKRTIEKRAKRFEGIISLFDFEIEITVGFISDRDEKFKTIYNYELGNN